MRISARHGDIYSLFKEDIYSLFKEDYSVMLHDVSATMHETKIKPVQIDGYTMDLELMIKWLVQNACPKKAIAYFKLGHNEAEAKNAADAIYVMTEKFLQTECEDRENCKGELVFMLANTDPYIIDIFNVRLHKL